MTINCPICDEIIDEQNLICPNCNELIIEDNNRQGYFGKLSTPYICQVCGAQNGGGSKFCAFCCSIISQK